MTCPTCNSEIGDEKKFCGKCGAGLGAVAAVSVSATSAAWSCPRCGNQISSGKKFCGVCGGPIQRNETPVRSNRATGIATPAPAVSIPSSGRSYAVTQGVGVGVDLSGSPRKRVPTKVVASVAAAFTLLLAVAAWSARGVELDVVSNPPGAEVALDGKIVGNTDNQGGGLSLARLARGTHVLRIAHAGFDSFSRPVSLGWFEMSHQLRVTLTVPSFPLTVLTNPGGARVQIDGRDVGLSDGSGNLVAQSIARGQHVVTVMHEGYPSWSNSLRIQSPSTIHADLAAAAAAAEQEIASRLDRAQQLFQQRQYDAAIFEYEAVLRLDPSNQQALDLKSQAQKAIATTAAAAAQQEIASRIGRAQQLYQRRQYQAAIAECDAALRLDPSNRQAAGLKSQVQETVKILGGH